jgi:hypothetical protein
MKVRRTVVPLLLCLVLMLCGVLTRGAAAYETDSEHVTFQKPTMVAGTLMQAGTYKLEWEDGGPQVQVTFTMGSKTIATVPATLVIGSSNYDGAVETKTLGDNSRVLEKITWKKKSLVFNKSS